MSDDDKSDLELARALGKVEGIQGVHTIEIERISMTLAEVQNAESNSASRFLDLATRVTALESMAHVRPRHASLTSDAVEQAMTSANEKQSASIKVAAMEANVPLVNVTKKQTETIQKQPWYVGLAVALAMFASTFATAMIQSCHH